MKKVILAVTVLALIIIVFSFFKITGFVNMSEIQETCLDSDFGNNHLIKGEVGGTTYDNVKLAPKNFLKEDKCESNNILVEFYCEEQGIQSKPKSTKYVCKDECVNGTCQEAVKVCSFFCKLKKIFS